MAEAPRAIVVAGEIPRRVSHLSRVVPRAALSARFGVVIVALGIVLRLLQLLTNRSLSQDEAMLALNVMGRSFGGLFRQLDFLQGAPYGFLALQKAVTVIVGANDYTLRLIPLACGVAALLLIIPLARLVVAATAVPVAAALFALSDPSIEWAAYAKQYAVDELAAALILLGGLLILERPLRQRSLVLCALAGALLVWLSHASIFMLGGMSLALVGGSLVRRELRRSLVMLAVSAPWLVSFFVFYATSESELSSLRSQISGSPGAYLGSGPAGLSLFDSLKQGFGQFRYVAAVPHIFRHGGYDLGQLLFLLFLAICFVGLLSLEPRNRSEKQIALVAPLGLMLIAWALHRYPLLGRTQLFLLPAFFLLMAQGVVTLVRRCRTRHLRAASVAAAALAVTVLFVLALVHLPGGRRIEDIKPVLAYVARHQRKGDTLFVFYTAQYQLRYYLECGCAGDTFANARKSGLWPLRPAAGGHDEFAPALRSVPPQFIVTPYRGRDVQPYTTDIDRLSGRRRVWVLLSSLETERRASLLRDLRTRGVLRRSFAVGSGKNAVGAYLFDLRRATG